MLHITFTVCTNFNIYFYIALFNNAICYELINVMVYSAACLGDGHGFYSCVVIEKLQNLWKEKSVKKTQANIE